MAVEELFLLQTVYFSTYVIFKRNKPHFYAYNSQDSLGVFNSLIYISEVQRVRENSSKISHLK